LKPCPASKDIPTRERIDSAGVGSAVLVDASTEWSSACALAVMRVAKAIGARSERSFMVVSP
jgi:hypothetical protein